MAKKKFKAYVLRTCDAELKSRGGFQWPAEGVVKCADWDPRPSYGYGLRGLLWGQGDSSLLDWDVDAQWLVVGIDEWVDLDGKVKFPLGCVVYSGDRQNAAKLLIELGADPAKCVGGTATAGDAGTATAGDAGTATAGDAGTATAGDAGTATAGDRGTATAGDAGTATAGNRGTATAGYAGTATAGYAGTATAGYAGTATAGNRGTATAGYAGTATAGYAGTATAGNRGTATAGYAGTATAGYAGTATAGYAGTATAGDAGTATAGDAGTATAGKRGVLVLRWWDEAANRYRIKIGYVGEDSIEPGKAYRLNDKHEFEETK